ncbi:MULTISPECIES: copper-binding protein [Ramlibacter]|uniref:Copper-binding protein n=1 Tax=Ramlibacter aquaticus TaxID=2780094 RepID=A0ABR9SG51_9BURK|nr:MULTISPECIES: copper-binding protein [Ramlibacter]MBE7941240.1 copper-binding protein [Ramlibacter aquaticus]
MKAPQRVLCALFAAAAVAHAQQPAASEPDPAAHHPAAGAQAGAPLLSEGEVRKVDPELGKVTLRHGPLTNLDMPGMTMVFTATDKKLLDGLKPGDKVRFTADRKDGVFVVTALEVVH